MKGLMKLTSIEDCVIGIFKGDYSLYSDRLKRISFNAQTENKGVPDPLQEAENLLSEMTRKLYCD